MNELTEMHQLNTDDQIALRRFRNTLRLAGGGYIVFGIWSIMKFLMMITMQQKYMEMMFDLSETMADTGMNVTVGDIIFIIVISLFVVGIHLWIGLGAVRYAQGSGGKRSHLVLAILGVIITIVQLPLYFYDPVQKIIQDVDMTTIASIVVDITLIFLFFDMIISTIQIDKLTRSTAVTDTDTATDKG